MTLLLSESQPMTLEKQKLGKEGEDLAVQHLISKNYTIVGRNLRIKHDELDILAKIDNTLVFVEVKTRISDTYGVPEDFITRSKEKCMVRFAENYIFENEWTGESRFDVIAIHYKGKSLQLKHIVDAFYPEA